MSAPKPPDIQVWLAEFDTKAKQMEILDRSHRKEGCTALFTGKTDEGKYVLILSFSGEALDTPKTELFGNRQYPDEPRVQMITGWSIRSSFKITESS